MSSSKEFDDIMQSTIQETIIAYTSKLSERAQIAPVLPSHCWQTLTR